MDPNPCQLVLFTRAPIPGHTKTRLARDVGDLAASHIAAAMLEDICRTLKLLTLPKICCYNGSRRAIVGHIDSDIELRQQSSSSVIARIVSALELKRKIFLLLGDVPQITAPMINEAVNHLWSPRTAYIGPVEDGGVWGIGLNEVNPSFLTDIDIGSNTFAVDTIRAIPNGVTIKLGQRLHDIDTLGDARLLVKLHPELKTSEVITDILGQ